MKAQGALLVMVGIAVAGWLVWPGGYARAIADRVVG